MKYQKLSFYLLIILVLTACSSNSTTEVSNGDVEPVVKEQEKLVEDAPVKATEVAVKNSVDHDKEIALINEEITKINQNVNSYTTAENTMDIEAGSCKVTHYLNQENALIKSTADCGNNFWEIYCIVTTGNSSKVIYSKLIQKNPAAGRPSVREFYTIGSMIQSDDVYSLVLDESGKEIKPEDYQTYGPLYEDAILNFL